MGATADVVIPIFRAASETRRCVERVLNVSGPALGRLILVDDGSPDDAQRAWLESQRSDRVIVLRSPTNDGFVVACNKGLSIARGHAVVLNSDTEVTPGWLDELLGVVASDSRIAAAVPLSNNATLASVPHFGRAAAAQDVRFEDVPVSALPRTTEMPTGVGFCMLMTESARALVGGFDPAFGRGYHEENDWCQRARALGFSIVRANRAYVVHAGQKSFGEAREAQETPNERRLVQRYPRYLEENRAFENTQAAHVAARLVRATGSRAAGEGPHAVHRAPKTRAEFLATFDGPHPVIVDAAYNRALLGPAALWDVVADGGAGAWQQLGVRLADAVLVSTGWFGAQLSRELRSDSGGVFVVAPPPPTFATDAEREAITRALELPASWRVVCADASQVALVAELATRVDAETLVVIGAGAVPGVRHAYAELEPVSERVLVGGAEAVVCIAPFANFEHALRLASAAQRPVAVPAIGPGREWAPNAQRLHALSRDEIAGWLTSPSTSVQTPSPAGERSSLDEVQAYVGRAVNEARADLRRAVVAVLKGASPG